MKKFRVVAAGLVLTMALTALTACGNGKNDQALMTIMFLTQKTERI